VENLVKRDSFYLRGSLLALTLALTSLAVPLRAHPQGDFYENKWIRDRSVDWMFTDTFPSNAWRDRVNDADGPWNAVGTSMHFVKQPEVNDFNALNCPSSYQKNGIHIGPIDGTPINDNTLARTYRCIFSGTNEWYSFQIKFDVEEPWYTGASTPPPAFAFDLQAVATHEFGHATGFTGHFGGGSSYCTETPKQTMCPTLAKGKAYPRSLETHDKHTFQNAY
jgi:hypothetical protein